MKHFLSLALLTCLCIAASAPECDHVSCVVARGSTSIDTASVAPVPVGSTSESETISTSFDSPSRELCPLPCQ